MGGSGYSDVLFRVARGIGWVTLNRPKALNALDHQMVRRIDAQLADWADDDAVGGVALTGAVMRPWIDACYSAGTAGQIVARLQDCPDPAAQRAARQIPGNSPTAVTVALRALRRARQLATLREELDQELRISAAALDSADLVEGIRAQVIDKDRRPSWSPATLAEVTSNMVDRYFTPVPLESARTGEEGGHAAGAALA